MTRAKLRIARFRGKAISAMTREELVDALGEVVLLNQRLHSDVASNERQRAKRDSMGIGQFEELADRYGSAIDKFGRLFRGR